MYILLRAAFLAPVNVGVAALHLALGMYRLGEAKFAIQPVRISRSQGPTPQALKMTMQHHHLHQRFRQSSPPIRLDNEHVSEIRERRIVGNHTCEADLLRVVVNSEAQ